MTKKGPKKDKKRTIIKFRDLFGPFLVLFCPFLFFLVLFWSFLILFDYFLIFMIVFGLFNIISNLIVYYHPWLWFIIHDCEYIMYRPDHIFMQYIYFLIYHIPKTSVFLRKSLLWKFSIPNMYFHNP